MKINRYLKVILIFSLLILIYHVDAFAVTSNLSEFIKEHSDIGEKTPEEIGAFLAGLDDATVQSTTADVSRKLGETDLKTILEDPKLKEEEKKNAIAEAIAYLDGEFSAYMEGYVEYTDENDPCYLYYGYMFGLKRLELEEAQAVKDGVEGKSDEDKQKEFNEIYDEYTKLTDEEKTEVKLSKIVSKLTAINGEIKDEDKKAANQEKINDITTEKIDESDPLTSTVQEIIESEIYIIYQNPEKISSSTSGEQSLSDVITDASQFISSGLEQEDVIDASSLQNFSKTYYNILFAIGVATSVIVGMILGIKIMMSTTDQKAEAKQLLVPYVVGCVIVFSGFAIWKLAVTILGSI